MTTNTMPNTNVAGLVSEYRTLFHNTPESTPDAIEDLLIQQADWTPDAAQQLRYLAQHYGAFMLRNALAVALALDIEDGDAGF